MEWIKTSDRLPPEGTLVETKIHDELSIRNETKLIRKGRLWFIETEDMYVYYVPTHWKLV